MTFLVITISSAVKAFMASQGYDTSDGGNGRENPVED
jgi:hypothetical protein